MKEYTDRYKGFQIRDMDYLGTPPTDRPPEYDVVYWYDEDYCYSAGRLWYDIKESCFRFGSVALRWLEVHPDKDVENWILAWCKHKEIELNEDED